MSAREFFLSRTAPLSLDALPRQATSKNQRGFGLGTEMVAEIKPTGLLHVAEQFGSRSRFSCKSELAVSLPGGGGLVQHRLG